MKYGSNYMPVISKKDSEKIFSPLNNHKLDASHIAAQLLCQVQRVLHIHL
jgi:hypothetical protein